MMRKFLSVAAVLLLVFWVSSLSSASFAAEGEATYSYGTVTSVSASSIAVKEYDYETDQEIEVTYALGPNLELKNADSLEDIVAGDSIEIDYIIRDAQKVATAITVENVVEEEGSMPTEKPNKEPDSYIEEEANQEEVEGEATEEEGSMPTEKPNKEPAPFIQEFEY